MLLRFLKNWTLPSAIALGTVLYLLFARVPALQPAADILGPLCETLLPVSIFLTLFVTFSKVDFHLMRLRRWHIIILLLQMLLTVLLTAAILLVRYTSDGHSLFTLHSSLFHSFNLSIFQSFNLSIFQSFNLSASLEAVLVCVIAPCASASPVVTAKLGGDLTQMTTFVLLSSLVTSLLIPAVFPILEPHEGATFLSAFLLILQRLATVLLFPLLLGSVVRHWVKPLYQWFLRTPDLGFYLWSVSLAITSGITVKNILHSSAALGLLLAIAALTLLTAIIQFRLGRLVGRSTGEPICTGQGMFQKNTGLAIWIAYIYLTPISSIGAGCYVLWQNIINSCELWYARRSAK